MMIRHEPASAHFRLHLALGLAHLAIAAVVLLWLPQSSLHRTDRIALFVAMTVVTVYGLRTLGHGGPRDASDYRLAVWIGLAVSGMAGTLALAHLADDRTLLAMIWGYGAILFAGVSAWVARFALLVNRLPELLELGEESRAFAVCISELDGREKRVAVMVTNRRLIIAAPHRGRARLASQCDLARVDGVGVATTNALGEVLLRADGALLALHQVPRGQALSLAAALEPRTG